MLFICLQSQDDEQQKQSPADQTGRGLPLSISIPGQECQLSVQELTSWPAQRYSNLWIVRPLCMQRLQAKRLSLLCAFLHSVQMLDRGLKILCMQARQSRSKLVSVATCHHS